MEAYFCKITKKYFSHKFFGNMLNLFSLKFFSSRNFWRGWFGGNFTDAWICLLCSILKIKTMKKNVLTTVLFFTLFNIFFQSTIRKNRVFPTVLMFFLYVTLVRYYFEKSMKQFFDCNVFFSAPELTAVASGLFKKSIYILLFWGIISVYIL